MQFAQLRIEKDFVPFNDTPLINAFICRDINFLQNGTDEDLALLKLRSDGNCTFSQEAKFRRASFCDKRCE